MAKRKVRSDYPTIQAAVNASESGDIIFVEKGIYRESVVVDRDGITLLACEGAVLCGGFELRDGFEISGADVVVQGFCVREFSASGFFCHDAGRLVLRGCTVENCGTDGIYLTRCSGIRLLCCGFSANGVCGVEAHDSPDLLASECRVISNGGNGVFCDSAGGAGIILRNCEVSRNNGLGIFGQRCNAGIIECEVMGNVRNGIQLDDCTGSQIERCGICSQNESGCVLNSDRCEILNTRITSNEGTGLIIAGNGCEVTGCLVNRNGESGVFVRGIRNVLTSNTVTQNEPFDIVRAAPNNCFKNNVTCNDNPCPLTGCDREKG